ncbi:MAG: cytidylyltransferase domain-containing protein, partial [Christensenellales bacterium]
MEPQSVVAFIPVRGGSKSISLKNIKPLAGRPLVFWTLDAALGCNYIDKIYVSTDSQDIAQTVESYRQKLSFNERSKLQCIGRSPETATDTASTESAMLEFARSHMFDNIVLIQATSPLLTSFHLDQAIYKYNQGKYDSMLSLVRQKRFIWHEDENGIVEPANYDPLNRPRRQEMNGFLVENGSFYITSR